MTTRGSHIDGIGTVNDQLVIHFHQTRLPPFFSGACLQSSFFRWRNMRDFCLRCKVVMASSHRRLPEPFVSQLAFRFLHQFQASGKVTDVLGAHVKGEAVV